MLRSLVITLLFAASCRSISPAEKLHQTLSGNWLVLAPDHNLHDGYQQIVYSHMQDSIIGLMGLTLITLSDNGTFQQLDSTEKKGRWGMTADNIVFIEKGGQGFDNFSGRFTNYKNNVLQLTESVKAEGETIELTWHLKKITGSFATRLFDERNNQWRKRPTAPETEKQIRQRLSAMLQYYSDYYKLVTREAEFFISRRVLLPFTFYQHAMAMKPLEEKSFFMTLFYNRAQAQQAWKYLKIMMSSLRNDFPRKKDFLEEYAEFMAHMGEEIVKE